MHDESGYDWRRDKPNKIIPFGKFGEDAENKGAELNRKPARLES